MSQMINPYIILGFLPDQAPAENEVKSRYRYLAKIHHPDVGGQKEFFQAINEAHNWIVSNGNPGPLYFGVPQASRKTEDGWKTNDKGNWVCREQGKLLGTVFMNDGKWKWVYQFEGARDYSNKGFNTAEEAAADFENTWLKD